MATETKAFRLEIADGIGRLTFDVPGEKVNTFSSATVGELSQLAMELAARQDIRALVVQSAKRDIFIAGADIKEIARVDDAGVAEGLARTGQELFTRWSRLPFPTIAVIDGACLGGGCEFALACTWRIATDAEKTSIGLPEVNLGILPGWGGTQRLPRLIAWPTAVDLILAGKAVDGRKALKMGLVDKVCARAFLDVEVPAFVAAVLDHAGRDRLLAQRKRAAGGFVSWFLGRTPIGRALVKRTARKTIMAKTGGRMPAPLAALDVLVSTAGGSGVTADRLAVEAKGFARLAVTPESRCLVDCFLGNESLKRIPGAPPGTPPARRAGVLGAGVMGGGIAWLFAYRGMPVRVKDIGWDAIARGFKTVADYSRQLVKIRKMTQGEATVLFHRVSAGLDYGGFGDVDLVVEAVVEDLGLKQKVLAELEGHVRPDCVLATNTSSLLVAEMAKALRAPERFVGMHFFNPVNRMPLVEVVAGPQSDPAAVGRAVDLVRRLGKTAIVVKDCPGFLVNRILLPYMNEAAWLLQDGAAVENVDRVLLAFGMPMGPFRLTDEVGIDVGHKVAKILALGYGARMNVADALHRIAADKDLKGVKGGKGFYLYGGDAKRGRRKPTLNPAIDALVAQARREANAVPRPVADAEIRDRCLLVMVNEAARCIAEQVVPDAAQLDLAMVMGTGFPPERGGPLHHADAIGIATVVERLKELKSRHGERFEPAPLLVEMAAANRRFFPRSA